MKNWFSVKAASKTLALSIHDEIGGWGIPASDLLKEIRDFKGTSISLEVHSPGGDAFGGLAIYHALKGHRARVTARVLGVAASAATLPLMAADRITMPEGGFIMIHDPWAVAGGGADELEDTADLLRKVGNSLASIYSQRTGLPLAKIQTLMAEETWLNATEARALGFADEVDGEAKIAALSPVAARHFARLPDALAPKLETARELETAVRDGLALPSRAAKKLVSGGYKALSGRDDREAMEQVATLIRAQREELQRTFDLRG